MATLFRVLRSVGWVSFEDFSIEQRIRNNLAYLKQVARHVA